MMFDQVDTTEKPIAKSSILAPVFFPAVGIIAALVIVTLIAGDGAADMFTGMQAWVTGTMGWVYMLAVAGFLIFCLYLAFSRLGEIKLGPNQSEPDYSFLSWFAMLFSAGIGIGLLFYGIAEPVTHFLAPLDADPRTVEAAREAMQITFFHWGVHGWAVYATVGLILAYFSFRHNLPLTIRSALYPLIGDRIHGPIGHIVDVFAVVGTLFGVAVSLGIGASQVNAGLNHLFDVPFGTTTQVILIALITACATVSVVMGLDAGIKKLSEINMVLAVTLLLFVILMGPTILFLTSFVENIGLYLETVITRSFRLDAYQDDNTWLGNWTLFYWGWWISWSPFVGIFIARISRGRTIREFILGVLLVPTAFTFIWMTAFGNNALALELNGSGAGLADMIENNLPLGIFAFLETLPFSGFVSFITIILVVTFFVTSSDSGSLVIDTITSGGHLNPPVWQRVFWAITQGIVAAVLMVGGGLGALRSATVASALPFTFVIIFACIGLLKGLRMETAKLQGAAAAPDVTITGKNANWKLRLDALLSYPSKDEMDAFMQKVIHPALEKVAQQIRESDAEAEVAVNQAGNELRILHGSEMDFLFSVHVRGLLKPDFAYISTDKNTEKQRFYRAEVYLLEGSQHYDVYGFSEDELIHDVLCQYNKHINFLNIARV